MFGQELLLIVFGWLLGLLAPIITAIILNQRNSKAIKAGIVNELVELKHRLVLSAFAFTMDYGDFDHDFLDWAKRHFDTYTGINMKEGTIKFINQCLGMQKPALKQFVLSQRDRRKGKSVKYARLPFLESQLSEIGLFSNNEQTQILEILEHVKIHNEMVDEAKDYFAKTFDPSVTGENRDIVESSLNEKYLQLAQKCRIIADRIEAFSK